MGIVLHSSVKLWMGEMFALSWCAMLCVQALPSLVNMGLSSLTSGKALFNHYCSKEPKPNPETTSQKRIPTPKTSNTQKWQAQGEVSLTDVVFGDGCGWSSSPMFSAVVSAISVLKEALGSALAL